MDAAAPSGDAELDDIVDISHDELEELDETPNNRGVKRASLHFVNQRRLAAASSSQTRQLSESQLMDLDALTSASEFHMTVNAWMADIDAEQRQANIIPAYQDTEATT